MALILKATYQAELVKIATALNVMWPVPDLSNPMHPLRDLLKQLDMDAKGVVTPDTVYVDLAYAGKFPGKKHETFSRIFKDPLVLVSATVENAAADEIVLTFGTAINQAQNLGVGGVVTTPKTIASTAIVTVVVTITVSSAYIATDTITVSGTFIAVDGSAKTLIDQVVVNNVL